MATTQNAGDLQLASTSPRMDTLPSTSTIDFANVTGSTKPANNATKNSISSGTLAARPAGSDGDIYTATDTTPPTEYKKIAGIWAATTTANNGIFSILDGRVNSINYLTYLSQNTVSVLGFVQNQTINDTDLYTSVRINTDNQNVVVIISGRLASDRNASIAGYSAMNAVLTVGGVTVYNDQLARFVNSTTADYNQVTASIPVQVNFPGYNSVLYALTITRIKTGNGTGGSVAWPTIQVVGLKV